VMKKNCSFDTVPKNVYNPTNWHLIQGDAQPQNPGQLSHGQDPPYMHRAR